MKRAFHGKPRAKPKEFPNRLEILVSDDDFEAIGQIAGEFGSYSCVVRSLISEALKARRTNE
jgi:hypothetical protein